MRERPARRQVVVAAAGLGVGVLAGCAGANDDSESGTDPPGEPTATDTAAPPTDPDVTASPADTDTTDDPDLDLREANVVGVTVERSGEAYDFDVTLHHDDDGEEGYANWWRVERLDGARLGRRELLHAHSRQPFTRSESVEIPDSVGCVVVRGHDRTHGYGGRLAVVDLESGTVRSVDQGPEPESVGAGACPNG